MQKINVAAFYKITTTLQVLRTVIQTRGKDEFKSDEDDSLFKQLRTQARELQSSLVTLGTRQTSKSADRFIKLVEGDSVRTSALNDLLKEIDSRLADELPDITVVALSPQEQDYFSISTETLFGKDFETKFPSALFEADEAAKCMAFALHTAAVFHLMRCMEIGIRAVAMSLDIPNPTGRNRNWGNILNDIKAAMDTKSKTHPGWKAGDRAIFVSAHASQIYRR
jgi:hypothetical protein